MADVLDFEVRMRLAEADIQRMNTQLRSMANNAQNTGDQMDSTFAKVGKTIGAVFATQQLVNFAKEVVNVRKEIESYEISFRTLLASQDKADALFGSLREFAAKTPMQLGDLAKGAQTLLGFGIEAEKIMPTLKQIGDISMGNADKFGSLTLAFAQMSSTGKLMGQDLLQMINAGFNPLAIIAEQTGKSIGDLKKDMEQGAVSAEMVAEAFKLATSEGGMFYGMLEQQGQGLAGAIAQLQGAWQEALNNIGTRSQEMVVTGIKGATTLVENYDKLISVILGLVGAYGAYKAALMATVAIDQAKMFADNIRLIAMFRKELGLLKAAQQAFNLTAMKNPYILLASAIIGVGVALYSYFNNASKAERATEQLNEKLAEQKKLVEDNRSAAKSAMDVLRDENATNKQKHDAYTELQKLIPQVTEKYSLEALAIMDVVKATKLLNQAVEEQGVLALKQKRDALVSEQSAAKNESRKIRKSNLPEEYRDYFGIFQNKVEQQDIISGLIRDLDERIRDEERASMSLDEKLARSKADLSKTTKDVIDAKKRLEKANSTAITGSTSAAQEAKIKEERRVAKDRYDYLLKLQKKYQQEVNDLTKAKGKIVPLSMQDINQEIKKYEKELKDAKKLLDDLRRGKKSSTNILADIEQAEKRIKDAQANLERLRGVQKDEEDKGATAYGKKAAEEAQRMADENYKNQLRHEAELAKVRDNNLEEYYNKQQALINKEYQDKLRNIEAERKEALKNANGESRKKINDAYDLQAIEAAEEYGLKTEQNTQAREANINKQKLDNYRKFVEEYLRIEQDKEERAKDIRKMQEEGKITEQDAQQRLETSENVALAEKTTLRAELGLTAEEMSALISETVTSTVGMSLDRIRNELPALESELKRLKEAGADPDKIAKTEGEIKVMKRALGEAKNEITAVEEQTEDTSKGSKTNWGIVANSLGTVNDALNEIMNTFGDMMSDSAKTAVSVMQTTLQATTSVIQAITATSTAASGAIKAAETASVVLAIISAAVQVIMTITNAIMKNFSAQAKHQQAMEEYQRKLERMEQAHEKLQRSFKDETGVNYWQELSESVEDYTHQLRAAQAAEAEAKRERDRLRDKYGEDSEKAQKAQEEVDQAEKTTQGVIDKGKEDLKEVFEKMATTDVTSFGEEMANALVDSFSQGLDGMQGAWDDTINNMIKSMLTQRLALQLTDQFEDAFSYLETATSTDNGRDVTISDFEMQTFLSKMNSAKEGAMAISEEYQKLFAEMGLLDDADINAESKGFQTMSQDTADELNGRFTALQISGANIEMQLGTQIELDKQALNLSNVISENITLAVQIATQQLQELRAINDNTAQLAETNMRLKNIQEHTARL